MCNISETALSECYVYSSDVGMYFATAGQRIDPDRESPFVWKETFTNTRRQKLSLMSYTNWYPNTPNYGYQAESCMNLWSGRAFAWNDYNCAHKICSVCEIDM